MNLREKAQELLCEALWMTVPYRKMGNVDTLDLFAPKELELLAFYQTRHYKKVADIGANVGLHAQFMAFKCGWDVIAYEPDPDIYADLVRNTLSYTVTPIQAAVSDKNGESVFTQVLDNRTGSHLVGKKSPYGPLRYVTVQTLDARQVLADVEFAKIDAEGSEWDILSCMDSPTDIITEITSPEIAKQVFERFPMIYAQKLGWERVKNVDQMPTKHQDGAVFITHESWL